jgi:hypothetical protein
MNLDGTTDDLLDDSVSLPLAVLAPLFVVIHIHTQEIISQRVQRGQGGGKEAGA